MRTLRVLSALLIVAAIGGMRQEVAASMAVRHMNLEDMCRRAARIFRGTVLGVTESRVSVGGTELPTLLYRIRVDEAFKGEFEDVKGERIATMQIVGSPKAIQAGSLRLLPLLQDLPRFERGHDYLIFATASSAVGLSTPVGQGQGAFKVFGKRGQETAVNGNNNVGLYLGMSTQSVQPAQSVRGPLSYTALAAQIRVIVGR